MLSYNWANQTEVKRIGEALRSHGFSVWIDVEHIEGYIDDAMRDAIISSKVVVACLTGQYDKSYNCKRELTYAADLRKPSKTIVPIRLDEGPFTWSELITAGNIYIDFNNVSIPDWDTKIKALVKEIRAAIKLADENAASTETSASTTTSSSMTTEEIKDSEFGNMQKALERGSLPVRRLKVVLVGQGRAGKTSLLRVLRDVNFDEHEKSTVFINPIEVDQHFLENWQESSKTEQLLKSVYAEMHSQTISNDRSFPNPKSNDEIATVETFAQLHVEKNPVTLFENEEVVKRLANLQGSISTSQSVDFSDTNGLDPNSTTLAVYDFAGQSQYSVFQQIFITAQSIYLVIFSLHDMFSMDSDKINPMELQVVLSWLTTIHLRAPEAKILLIGTKADKLPLIDSSQLSLLLSYIPNTIKPSLVSDPGAKNPHNSQIFVTSAKHGTGVKNLRDVIDQAVHSSVSESGPKPVDWIRFQDKIAELVASEKCPLIYTLSDLLQITATDFRIREREELDAVLRYFHTIGVVLYFPQNGELKDFVFPDPQAVVNVISSVFRYIDNPPMFGEVNPKNIAALEKLKEEKIWMRSLLEELWSRFLQPNELSALYGLLQEFDLICDIKMKVAEIGNFSNTIHHDTMSIMPCLLSNVESQKLIRNRNFEVIDLILGFPDNVLPAGLYHQLSVRFAANSPHGYIPVVHRSCARVLVSRREVIIEEDFMSGIIRLQLCLRKHRIRADFEEVYAFLIGISGNVIKEHWSKRSLFYVVPKCESSSTPSRKCLPHGIKNIPAFNEHLPDYPIQCNNLCHGVAGGEIETIKLGNYWFLDGSNDDMMISTSPPTEATDLLIDDGFGAIMISYSWGPKDNNTKLYPNQERAKRLADALEKRGRKVWIDTRFMRGNMFSKMGKVITNCMAVIACVSKDYHKEDSNADKEFNYACGLKKKIYGVKLAKDTNMMEGSYGFNKGHKDKFYNLADCESNTEYEAVVEELVRDLAKDEIV
ncbi:hypothetical protein HK098_006316 [Nowakowskiella sp. JEL0407]|nr:hypothetical protein HK098_006316 [Nowakowskiella sp. JEL0407]